jgi:ubiquinone/menaquinone biosynthesis C-methylase UbiE
MKELLAKEKQKQILLKKFGYDIPRSRNFVLAKSRLKKGSLLEVGTGKGHFTVALAKKGFSLTSIDLDPAPQKMAREYLRQGGIKQRARILVMNAEELKFPDHSFESIISVNFMHHAENPIQCLTEMARVARSKIVIADINKKGEAVLERAHKRDGHSHPRSRISFEAMRAFLQKKGFTVKTYKGFCQTILVAQKEV